MRTLAVAMVFAAASVYAEPRAKSAEECVLYADLALVASTLAKHGIQQEKTAAMIPDMYQLDTENSREIARQILTAAYQPHQQSQPKYFAATVGTSCLRSGGSMGILGVTS
jgi:hypothetical protein